MQHAPQDLGVNLVPDNPAYAPNHALILCAYLCASTRDSSGNACRRVIPVITVTIPPLDPSARDEEESDYDEEALVWAAAMEHATEVEDEETPDEYDWQISRLVSTATYPARPDAGRVSTGRMKIT